MVFSIRVTPQGELISTWPRCIIAINHRVQGGIKAVVVDIYGQISKKTAKIERLRRFSTNDVVWFFNKKTRPKPIAPALLFNSGDFD